MGRYLPAVYLVASLISVLISNWALHPLTMLSYLGWIVFGPITLVGFASAGGWEPVVLFGSIYIVATLGLTACYRVGQREAKAPRLIARTAAVFIWLLCAGINLWVVGHAT
jgi:hypothetical protein